VLTIRGIAAVLFGLVALIFPGIALLAFVFVFGAYALIDGITAIFVAFQERGIASHWVALLLEGIVSIIIGILAFVLPGITALVLLYLVAAWAIITGVMEISAAFMRRLPASREWALGLAGLLSIIFGVILFVHPGAGLLAILWLVGIYAIVFGVLLIVRSFQFRS
jgi:uncharacterized membrane protein HdeD (DUF308 family)